MATLAKTARLLKLSPPQGWPRLIYMTDATRDPDPLKTIAALAKGTGVIFRHYDHPTRGDLGRAIRALCQRKGLLFLVAGDARLARHLKADGLHLPEFMLTGGDQRWQLWRQRGWLLTAAVHSDRTAEVAIRKRCQGLFVSPVFPTDSHPDGRVLGIHGLLRIGRNATANDLGVYALGGLTQRTARRLKNGALAGLAGISGFRNTDT